MITETVTFKAPCRTLGHPVDSPGMPACGGRVGVAHLAITARARFVIGAFLPCLHLSRRHW
jgi:hypothetical protein